MVRGPLRVAEARMAAEYVARAEAWAQEVDEQVAAELVQVHRRLLERIDQLTQEPAPPTG